MSVHLGGLVERTRRRQMVLDAARRVFADRGYHDASVADIVEAAEIARGTFYLYFDGKRAIFDELVDQFLLAIRSGVRRVEMGEQAPPPHVQLRANVSRVLALLFEEREMAVILLNHAVGLDRESDEKLRGFHDRMAEGLVRALEAGSALGLVSTQDPEVAARVILGGVQEVVRFLVVQEGGAPRDHDRLVEEILRIALRGVAQGPLRELDPVPAGAARHGEGRTK